MFLLQVDMSVVPVMQLLQQLQNNPSPELMTEIEGKKEFQIFF
jgi:hypothetical protein